MGCIWLDTAYNLAFFIFTKHRQNINTNITIYGIVAKSKVDRWSNHTLKPFGDHFQHHVQPFLAISYNQGTDDINKVAIMKILHHHPHCDMKPLFEMENENVACGCQLVRESTDLLWVHQQARLEIQKQDAIYQFIHAMPETFDSL